MKKFIIFTLFFPLICSALFSQTKIDSLETQLLTAKGQTRVIILSKLVTLYRNIEPRKAIEYGEEALTMLDEIDDEFSKATFLNDLGCAYYNQKDFEAAIKYIERSLKIAKAIGHLPLQAATLNGLGVIYWGQRKYEKALEKYFLALEIQEEIKDQGLGAMTLSNIGLLFYSLKNFDKSLEYFFKALEIQEELGNTRDIALVKQNIANVYSNQNKPEKTLEYYLSSLKNCEEIGDERLSGIILTNIAVHYYEEFNDPDKALEYFNRSLIITQKYDDKENILRAFFYIGTIYIDTGKYEKAMEKENEALRIAQEINDYRQIKYIYREISNIYAKQKDFENAYEFHVKYKTVNDSIFSIEQSEQITEMETKYETEKKEQQIVLLEKDNTIARMKIKRQRLLLLYSVIGIVLILAFVLILSNLYRQKTKTAKALAVANRKLEELSRTDPLTKLWNRRYLHEIVERERVRIKRSFEAFSFILMDIDHFKNVNDTYGHECGDYVLSTMAVILRSGVRKQDVVGRWGGEEFLLFLPSTSLQGAITIAESIRKKIADYPFIYDSKNIAITSTLGVSEFDETVSVEECIKLADDGLYEGKESGRNRIVSVQIEDKGV